MRARLIGTILAVAAAATGCGADTQAAPPPVSGAPGFPITMQDCDGRSTTIDTPPQRIVTSNASGLELLFWLGAGDRVIGTGFPPGKGTLPAEFDAKASAVPVLGDMVIPKEKLLGSGADLYLDTFADMGTMGGMGTAPTEQEFTAAGIKHVFVKSTACSAKASGALTDLSTVEADLTALGTLTGTSARAAELVAKMQASVAKAKEGLAAVTDRPSYFFFDFDAGTQQPIAVCGKQVANAVITLAGARNIFADCDADFRPVGWEDIVSKNPAWIQLGVRDKGSVAANDEAFAAAEKFLREFPATAGLDAVRNGKFVRIGSEQTTISGVRNAETVLKIAATVHPGAIKADK